MSHDALPIAWHVTMRLRVDRLIARMACEYRLASRIILKLGGRCGLLAHRVVDTHIHALVGPSREQAGRFALHVESSLQQSLGFGQPFEPARFTPIVDLRHLYRSVPYVLGQAARHGARLDPVHDGSALADLVGLRCIDGAPNARLEAALPRFDSRELLSLLGVTGLMSAPVRAEHLADAAAGALALSDIRGRSAHAVLARRAAIAVAAPSLRTHEVADALEISPRRVQEERCEPVPEPLVRAVELQAKLRARLANDAGTPEVWDDL